MEIGFSKDGGLASSLFFVLNAPLPSSGSLDRSALKKTVFLKCLSLSEIT